MKLKYALSAALIGAGMILAGAAHAAKIGYVDATKVVEQSPQYEAARKALETEFTKRDKALVEQQAQLKKMEEKLVRDADVMSADEARRLETDVRARRRQVENAKNEFREDFNLRRNEEFNKLRRQVQEVIRELGKEEGIDIIFSDGVVYAGKEVDISDKVLERLKSSRGK